MAANGAVYYTATPSTHMGNIPIDQFAAAVYPPGFYFLLPLSFELFLVFCNN